MKNILNSDKPAKKMIEKLGEYYDKLIASLGGIRFSNKSKMGFRILAKFTKYKHFQKSGGSI